MRIKVEKIAYPSFARLVTIDFCKDGQYTDKFKKFAQNNDCMTKELVPGLFYFVNDHTRDRKVTLFYYGRPFCIALKGKIY
jgi:hypothetical protein